MKEYKNYRVKTFSMDADIAQILADFAREIRSTQTRIVEQAILRYVQQHLSQDDM